MTDKLFQKDSYLFSFTATVVEITKRVEGYGIILNRTAFYPESGGQLADKGTLDGIPVEDVQKEGEESIIHFCHSWNVKEGDSIKGVVDSEFRLGNMRRHTGQHILSGSFLNIADARTVSAHLGAVESTIEIDTDKLTDEQIRLIEADANRIIMRNDPIEIGFVEKAKLSELKVRKIPDREGVFRIVKIGEHDNTACGGTHCHVTGEVGMVKIISKEKIREHYRFTFLAGLDALEDYRLKNDITGKLSVLLTCHYTDLPETVEKLNNNNIKSRREIGRLNRELQPYEAEKLRENAREYGNTKVISGHYHDYNPKAMKNLALYLGEFDNSLNILVDNDRMIISVAENVSIKAGDLAKLFISEFGGKGGGNKTLAQIGRIPTEELKNNIMKFIDMIGDKLDG